MNFSHGFSMLAAWSWVIGDNERTGVAMKWVGILLCHVAYAVMAAEPVNVLDLGVKNDGSQDVSTIVNAASAKHSLYFPAGLYRVSHPLKIANSVTGVGYARLPQVDATRTWFISDIGATNANSAVIEVERGRLVNLENFNIRLKGREKGMSLETTQGRFFALNGIGIYGVASVGLDVHGSGSRPVFADRLTIFGSRTEPQNSKGIVFRGSVDCRLTDTEVMGVCVALELFNGHTYASNLHLWTGIMGGPSDVSWWKNTRGIVLGAGANFAGSQIYPDTSYHAIEQVGDGAICEISNVMYWEDGSVRFVKDRTGTFYHRPPNMTGKLIVHGGLVGVGGSDAKPGCTRSYVPNETLRDVMLKSAYAIKAGNLDWLCTGDSLPDYTVRYADKGWCKVADIVMEAPAGFCTGTIQREDGMTWRVAIRRAAGSRADIKVDSITANGDPKDVEACEDGGVVRVFVRTSTRDATTFRFHTESMGSRFRPIDHGSLRDKSGKARYREVRPEE